MVRRRRGYLASEARKAAHGMRPDRVLARFFSGGKYTSWGGIARAATGAKPSGSIPMRPVPPGSPLPATKAAAKRARAAAAQQQLDDTLRYARANSGEIARAATAQAKKNAAKGGGKKTAAYEAAKKIPARNQAAAKKAAASAAAARKPGARKAATGSVQVPKRNPDGTFDGSVSFPTFGPAEQAAYERALRGQVDPVQRVRQPRRWK